MPTFYAKSADAPIRIGFLVFEGTKLLDVAGPLQVFSDARTECGGPAYAVDLASENGGMIGTDTVCQIGSTAFQACDISMWDTVLVSGGDAAFEAMSSAAILHVLDTASRSCRRLGSICLGAFVLAAGGHLAGRRATTHWDGCARLAAQFPDILVEDDAIYVEDKGIWTSAGVTAGIDMALDMVKQDLGAAEAMRIAKSLVLPVHRSGGQRQFSAALSAQSAGRATRFANLIADIASNLRARHAVADLAARAGMSERTFSRRFTQALGVSPAQYVERLRVSHAASLLDHHNVTLIAAQEEAGFANAEQMRRAFHRTLGVSPSDYAKTFGR